MSEESRIYLAPLVVEDNILGEEAEPSSPRNVYIYRSVNEINPGLAYTRSFAYISGGKLYRTYLRTISGVYHLFVNDLSLGPLYGTLYGIAYNGRQHGLAVQLSSGIHAFVVLEGTRTIFEFLRLRKGLLSKYECVATRIDPGLAGDNIFAVIHTRGRPGTKCNDIVVYPKSEEEYAYKEYQRLTPTGWNGKWFSYISTSKNMLTIHFHLWDKSKKKYKISRTVFPSQFLIPNSIIYYDPDSDIVVFNNTVELMSMNLENQEILWRKSLGGDIKTPYIETSREEVIAYTQDTLYVIDVLTGELKSEIRLPGEITAANITDKYLLVGTDNVLWLYRRANREFEKITRYLVGGTIKGISIVGEDMLIGYVSPGEIPKVIYTNLADTITFRFPRIELTANSVAEFRIEEINPTIKVLKKSSPHLFLSTRGNKIIAIDRGSKPGEHTLTIQIGIEGFLPIIDDIKVEVSELKRAFRKIRIQSTVVPSHLGVLLPIVLDSVTRLDELYIVLSSTDRTVYGSSSLVRDIGPGERIIPIYLIWAKAGIHEAVMRIIGWSKRNKIVEEFNTKIKIDYDIPPFYLRVAGGVTYIWSPFDIHAVRITLRSRNAEYSIMHDLNTGWNEIDTHGLIPDEAIIYLQEGITYVVRRGQSWIQLVK